MATLEILGTKNGEVIDDERSMSSIDLHSRTMAAEYEAIHLNARPVSPLNMVISKSSGGSLTKYDSCEWPEMSIHQIEHLGGKFSKLEIWGKTSQLEPRVEHIHEHRKSRPSESKGPLMQLLPGTVKLISRPEECTTRDEIINVTKYTLAPKKANLPVIMPATLGMVRFDEGVRGVNDRMNLGSTPPLGPCEPLGEARHVQHSKISEMQRIRRYRAGVPPVKRISYLEKDLQKIIRRRNRRQQSHVRRELLSPPSSRGKPVGGSSRPDQPRGTFGLPLSDTGEFGDAADISVSGQLDAYSLIFSECSDPTLSTQQRLGDDDDDICSAKSHQDAAIPTVLRVQRGQDPAFPVVQREDAAASGISPAQGSVRSPTGGSVIEYSRDDCGPATAGVSEANDLPVLSYSVDQSFGETFSAPRPNSTIPHVVRSARHAGGKLKLADRIPAASQLSSRIVGVEVELKARVVCVSCSAEAAMWCIECERSYCPVCWNKVPHHEFVDPDEVWVNRRPAKPTHLHEHSANEIRAPMKSTGKVSEGLPHKRFNQKLPKQGKVGKNRMSTFISPKTFADKGFVHAQNWAALEDDFSVNSGSILSNMSKSASRLNVAVDEDMTDFGGEYLESLSHLDVIGDSLSDGEESPSTQRKPYVRTTTSRRRTPDQPPRVLSERARSTLECKNSRAGISGIV